MEAFGMATQSLRHAAREQFLAQLTAIYPTPDGLESAEAFARTTHEDLVQLTLDDLDRERFLARWRWALGDPCPWLAERIARLDCEAERRRHPRKVPR